MYCFLLVGRSHGYVWLYFVGDTFRTQRGDIDGKDVDVMSIMLAEEKRRVFAPKIFKHLHAIYFHSYLPTYVASAPRKCHPNRQCI